jgi:hypothetical protein
VLDTFTLDVDWDGDGTFEETGIPVAFGSFAVSHTFSEAPGTHPVNVRLWDDDLGVDTTSLVVTVTPPPPSSVVDVHLFYNGSKFDNNGLAVTAADFAAIASDKDPLTFGGSGSLANISGYARGINGVFFDVADLPGDGAALVPADLVVRTGNTDFPDTWAAGPAPTGMGVFANIDGAGTDRIFVTFANGALADTWVRLTLQANAHTGLPAAADYFFGSVPGETGAAVLPGGVSVDSADLQSIAQDISPILMLGSEPIDNGNDLN